MRRCIGWHVCLKVVKIHNNALRVVCLLAASEDIGNSNPNALLLAGECFRSVQAIGMPECRIILGQCAVLTLATSAKSNSTYLAINRSDGTCFERTAIAMPLHLGNANQLDDQVWC